MNGPVFIAGVERSGTSLIYALLGSHPDIAMSRRTNLWRYVYGQYGDLSDPARLDDCLSTLRRYQRLLVLNLDFDALRRAFMAGPATYERLFELIWQQVADHQGKPRWGDKSLLTERFADVIVASYPGARILHMMRDPRDRFASAQTRWGGRLTGVGGSTAEWVASAKLALGNQDEFPDSYRIVTYEDLAAEPVRTLEKICDFIDCPYTSEMLEMRHAESFRESGGNSSYGNRAAGAISTDSIGRYRSVLSTSQIEFIDVMAGDLMGRIGYTTDPPSSGWRRRLGRAGHPVELALFGTWRLREARNARRTGSGVPQRRIVELDEAAT